MIDKMRKINAKHNDNMDSRKNALKTLMSGIPVGDKVFVLVPVEDLHIDESYQRPVQKHVNTIAQEWDDMKCNPLKVNYREDGNLYVWDGQHRLVALKLMGIDYVLCVITVGLTQKQEAALFGCQGNGLRNQIHMIFIKLMYVVVRKLIQQSKICVINMDYQWIEIVRNLEICHVLHLQGKYLKEEVKKENALNGCWNYCINQNGMSWRNRIVTE